MATAPCPCTSGRKLDACCGPYLAGAEPPDAVHLMRSRFAAYALGRAEHLWSTLAGSHPDRAQAKDVVLLRYRQAAAGVRFRRLDVLASELAEPPATSRVLFVARVFEKGRDVSFAELSEFVHDGTGWRYVTGVSRELSGIKGDPLQLTVADFSPSVSGTKSSP